MQIERESESDVFQGDVFIWKRREEKSVIELPDLFRCLDNTIDDLGEQLSFFCLSNGFIDQEETSDQTGETRHGLLIVVFLQKISPGEFNVFVLNTRDASRSCFPDKHS